MDGMYRICGPPREVRRNGAERGRDAVNAVEANWFEIHVAAPASGHRMLFSECRVLPTRLRENMQLTALPRKKFNRAQGTTGRIHQLNHLHAPVA